MRLEFQVPMVACGDTTISNDVGRKALQAFQERIDRDGPVPVLDANLTSSPAFRPGRMSIKVMMLPRR